MRKLKRFYQLVLQLWHSFPPDDVYYYMRAKANVDLLLVTLNENEMMKIRDAWRGKVPLMHLKYFQMERWMTLNLKRAVRLGLDKMPFSRALDIGAGFGYFPYIAKFYGCDVTALDIPEEPLYDEVMKYFGVPKIHHTIKPFEPLPKPEMPYDLITGFQIMFNATNPWKREFWGAEEWRFFLKDITENQLSAGGRLYLELNYPQRFKGGYSPEIEAVFKEFGAKISGPRIDIQK
ncbi:MAG: hypothetical protein GC136_02560 [Alphaproteobacteria bacterium]|nr:hypothetical protein [Alphaproteobacteria bacterium]